MSYTPAVKQLTKLEQAHEPCYWTPGWVDGMALSAATAASYSLTTLRTNAALNAGQPVFVKVTVDSETEINFNNTAAAVTTETDGAGSVLLMPNQPPRIFYCDSLITALSFFSTAGGKVSLEIYKS